MPLRLSLRIAEFFIRFRIWVVAIIALLTVFLLFFAQKGQVRTDLSDLMPADHPYIKVHQEFKESLGGSNLVSIMLEVKEGDIFNKDFLMKVQKITRDLRLVPAVNDYQIISLAARKVKEVSAGTYGIVSFPLMWPKVPETQEEIDKLRESVLSNRLVYGTYVSIDLKAALITVDFIERALDYKEVYKEITKLVNLHRDDTVTIRVVGEPILQGLVDDYMPRTLYLFIITIGFLALLLLAFFMRSFRGTLLPVLAAFVSAIWALGIASLLEINFDPLGVVIAFLITARVISHSVQSVSRFDLLIAEGITTAKAAAQSSLGQLFKPGLLSVVTDAGGILVVALAPIPLLQKTAIIGTIWVSCIIVSGIVLTPVLLSWIHRPDKFIQPYNFDPIFEKYLAWCGKTSVSSRSRRMLLWGSVLLIIVCGYFGSKIHIGDANPGTPLFWPESEYNSAVTAINERFLGTDRMFVVVRGDKKDILKEPEILQNIARFQRYAELQPEIGGSLSIADLIPGVRVVFFEDNPRFQELGGDKIENGEMLYMYLLGSVPGDMDRFCDTNYQNAGIMFFFRDHKGETMRTAMSRMKKFIQENPMQGAHYELAGGLIGVLAAANEVIFSGQVESISLALLVILITSAITYRSGVAGLYFIVPLLLSNTITFAFMYFSGIGLNVNSLPVAALGIGLGVNYSIYVIDFIKEDFVFHGNLEDAIHNSLRFAGRGVILSTTPLVICTILWYLFASLRFQAEMAILIAIWMTVSAVSSLLVMPAMVCVLQPRFIVGNKTSEGS